MGFTLSVCMIVRDEEAILERCLNNAAKFADELILLDTGSVDGSVEIAKRYTDKVFNFQWVNDFSAARNASYEKATCDYIMWLDADDTVSMENIEKIRRLKENNIPHKLILAPYENPLNNTMLIYSRMVKRGAGFFWEGSVHEHLVYGGKETLTNNDVFLADFIVTHSKIAPVNYQRNIALMEQYCRPEEFDSFWFCANCFLDCSLAGETEKANKYLELAEVSKYPPFNERLNVYRMIHQILKYHKKTIELIKWNNLYLKEKNKFM